MTKDRGVSEFKSFSGILQAEGNTAPVIFRACINPSGEVEFDFGQMPLTQETVWIMHCWHSKRAKLSHFSLSGKSEDGTEFKTESLYFNGMGSGSGEDGGSYMSPNGGCEQAEYRRKLAEPAQKPQLRMHVKGFQSFGQLNFKCNLGIIAMHGATTVVDPDAITGYIAVQPDNVPADLSAWRAEADKLLEHIQRVMSFATATKLGVPVIEYYAGDDLEVLTFSQSRQTVAHMPTFHFLDQQPIFEAAITNFFTPPFKVKNLFFAIEWFAMDSTYSEVRLVNAMTVLENLVASNLGDDDVFIRPLREFEKTKSDLRKVIKAWTEKWSINEDEKANEVLEEFNEKFGDLNRRSIKKKLYLLAERWKVPLDGIDKGEIEAAIKARNRIIHRGHYYEDISSEHDDNLWRHVTIMREIVVRFLLTAIGYQGRYMSYFGGYHHAQFPPQKTV